MFLPACSKRQVNKYIQICVRHKSNCNYGNHLLKYQNSTKVNSAPLPHGLIYALPWPWLLICCCTWCQNTHTHTLLHKQSDKTQCVSMYVHDIRQCANVCVRGGTPYISPAILGSRTRPAAGPEKQPSGLRPLRTMAHCRFGSHWKNISDLTYLLKLFVTRVNKII